MNERKGALGLIVFFFVVFLWVVDFLAFVSLCLLFPSTKGDGCAHKYWYLLLVLLVPVFLILFYIAYRKLVSLFCPSVTYGIVDMNGSSDDNEDEDNHDDVQELQGVKNVEDTATADLVLDQVSDV